MTEHKSRKLERCPEALKSPAIDRELELLDARLAVERMEQKAEYLSRGRSFRLLADASLKRRWVKYLRREFREMTLHRMEGHDLSAEISIREIGEVQLPPDLIDLIAAYFRKTLPPLTDRSISPN